MSKSRRSNKIDPPSGQPAAEQLSRRESAKKLAKMAYVAPVVLGIVNTAERPAFGGVPSPPPTPP